MNNVTPDKMRWIGNVILVAACAIAFTGGRFTAWAYSNLGYKQSSNSVSYLLDSYTLSSSGRTAIQSAEATWDSAGSSFRFNYAGTYNSSSSCPAYPYLYATNAGASGWVGATARTMSGSTITFVYTKFNSYYSLTVGATSTSYDIQSVATHEFGHWLHLGDLSSSSSPSYCTTSSESTMCGTSTKNTTRQRSLTTDDTNGIKAIYP